MVVGNQGPGKDELIVFGSAVLSGLNARKVLNCLIINIADSAAFKWQIDTISAGIDEMICVTECFLQRIKSMSSVCVELCHHKSITGFADVDKRIEADK